MILRKRNRINRNNKLIIEKVNMKNGDTLIAKYPTDEYGEPMIEYVVLKSMHEGLKEVFGEVIMLPDKVSFGKIHKELDNTISASEIIKIKDEIFDQHGYVDEWVQAECWTELLNKLKID
ncbi:hypothetical protein [Terrisporobacter sp.]|uniref:hypothetical protein n=1 Tax=Terrisporobacter sp. TaxID=1965305 RepID=UPI00289C09B5|nr:hypothetical protein [Terrisporobacter sp.]